MRVLPLFVFGVVWEIRDGHFRIVIPSGVEGSAVLWAAERSYSSRLMIDAAYPAPKPLSMFTTVTFDAQEFSIPSSAAMP